jgi:hypothetical protein
MQPQLPAAKGSGTESTADDADTLLFFPAELSARAMLHARAQQDLLHQDSEDGASIISSVTALFIGEAHIIYVST